MFRFWSKVQGLGTITVADISTSGGAANQLIKVNAAGTAFEFDDLTSNDASVTITQSAGGIDLSVASVSGGATLRVLSSDTTVDTDNSYLVTGDLSVTDTANLTLNGALGVF